MGVRQNCPCDLVTGLCVAKKSPFTFALKIHLVVGSFAGVTFPTHMAFMKLEILCTCSLQYLLDDSSCPA